MDSAVSLHSARLRLAGIVEESIVDGPGLRLVLFAQGCNHGCPGCHNPQTHALHGGSLESAEHILDLYMQNPLLAGMTFSGGEPFLQAPPLAAIARAVHSLGGDIVTYTGFYYEDLLRLGDSLEGCRALLEETDLLIDGPFLLQEQSLELEFRGSSNQRLLTRALRQSLSSSHNAA